MKKKLVFLLILIFAAMGPYSAAAFDIDNFFFYEEDNTASQAQTQTPQNKADLPRSDIYTETGERQDYYADYCGYTLENFIIPHDRQYNGVTAKGRDMLWENGKLYELVKSNGQWVWAQHIDPNANPTAPGTYIVGCISAYGPDTQYTGGTPVKGNWKIQDGKRYLYTNLYNGLNWYLGWTVDSDMLLLVIS